MGSAWPGLGATETADSATSNLSVDRLPSGDTACVNDCSGVCGCKRVKENGPFVLERPVE